MKYPASELVLNGSGQVYHLGLLPENVASKVILVGDQDRVQLVSSFFDSVEYTSQHREFVCHTGTFDGKRISVISTGIGTDNIDIVINELDALFNIDLTTRTDKPKKTTLELIRIGTCGILQPEIPVHSYLLSAYAFGLDNVAHFYPINYTPEESQLCSDLTEHLQLPAAIRPYAVSASENLLARLRSEKTFEGITVTSSGFYGPQGRSLRLGMASPDMNEKLMTFRGKAFRTINFEMESSALFALGKALGHSCATICLGIANRPANQFSRGYSNEMNELIEYVLKRI